MSMKVYDMTRHDEVTKETKGYDIFKPKNEPIDAKDKRTEAILAIKDKIK